MMATLANREAWPLTIGNIPSGTAPVPVALLGGEAAALAVGQTLQARVIALLSDGAARLATPAGQLEVRPPVPLPVGAVLSLVVEGGGAAPRLALTQAVADGRTLFPASGTTAAGTGPQLTPSAGNVPQSMPSVGNARQSTPPTGSAPQLTPGQVLSARVAEILPDGRALLVSNTMQMAAKPPGPLGSLAPGAGVTLAVRAAGPVPELAILPQAPASPAAPAASPAAAAAPAAASDSVRDPAIRQVVAQNLHHAAAVQGGLAGLFADLAAIAAKPAPGLPEPAMRAIAHLLGLRFSGTGAPTADEVRQAFSRSGIFHEATLAPGAPQPAAANLKQGLLALRAALGTIAGGTDAAGGTGATGGTGAAGGAVGHGMPLRPPRRGALPEAQAMRPPTIAHDAPVRDVAQRLLAETEGALARMRLMQMASLPDGDAVVHRAEAGNAEWTFEVPMALGEETAILQFRVERDGSSGGANEDAIWRLAFSMDVETTGAVHVQLRFGGGRIGARLWAERAETVTLLRGRLQELREMLVASDLEVGDVQVRRGRPPQPLEAATGQFLDKSS